MRLALVSLGVPLGGSTIYMLNLAAALQRMGVATEVFSFTCELPLKEQFAAAGVRVHTCDQVRHIFEDRLRQLYEAVKSFRPDAVLAVLGVESFEFLRYLPSGVLRMAIFLDRAVRPHITGPQYRGAIDHLIVGSAYLIPEVEAATPDLPCTCIPFGIPIPKSLHPRDPNPSDPLRLLYYGRVENVSKGVRLFPEIAQALNQRGIPFRWTIHGEGPEEAYLHEALRKEESAGQVRFSTPIPHDQLPALVRAHDIYLLSSTNEGGPMTLLESMILGLVPVCGDIPGLVQDVVRATNGFRVPREDAHAYAEAVGTLHHDRALLETLSQAARQAITELHSSDKMAERYLSVLRSSLGDAAAEVSWPEKIHPLPILDASPWTFSPLGRLARRTQRLLRRLTG